MISFVELIDIIGMSLFLGWLFEDYVRPKVKSVDDVVNEYLSDEKRLISSNLWYSMAVVAPSVVLHELAHKFVALMFGYEAVFFAFYREPFTLVLGLVAAGLKLMNSSFLILVPGFVAITGEPLAYEAFWIAFSGPLVHLVFFIGSWVAMKQDLSATTLEFLHYSKYINGFLFIFNMLPIAGFDGAKVFSNLFEMI